MGNFYYHVICAEEKVKILYFLFCRGAGWSVDGRLTFAATAACGEGCNEVDRGGGFGGFHDIVTELKGSFASSFLVKISRGKDVGNHWDWTTCRRVCNVLTDNRYYMFFKEKGRSIEFFFSLSYIMSHIPPRNITGFGGCEEMGIWGSGDLMKHVLSMHGPSL